MIKSFLGYVFLSILIVIVFVVGYDQIIIYYNTNPYINGLIILTLFVGFALNSIKIFSLFSEYRFMNSVAFGKLRINDQSLASYPITKSLALELNVIGLINLQFAVKDEIVYVLEVNPRSSRTVPFVSKYSNISLANIAAQLSVGKKLKDFKLKNIRHKHVAVKKAVLPFKKFKNEKPLGGTTVLVRNGDVNGAMRVLKKRLMRDGFFQELRERSFYESRGTKRRKEKAAATRRYKRNMQKRKDELGY